MGLLRARLSLSTPRTRCCTLGGRFQGGPSRTLGTFGPWGAPRASIAPRARFSRRSGRSRRPWISRRGLCLDGLSGGVRHRLDPKVRGRDRGNGCERTRQYRDDVFAVLPHVRDAPDSSDDDREITRNDRSESGYRSESVRVMPAPCLVLLEDHHADDGNDQDTRNENEEHDVQWFHGSPISATGPPGLTAGSGRTLEVQFHTRASNLHVWLDASEAVETSPAGLQNVESRPDHSGPGVIRT